MIYSLYTLVDITCSGVYYGPPSVQKDQQQNFNTVIQTIGLLGNMSYTTPPRRIPAHVFGMEREFCWHFSWTMDATDVFVKGDDPIGNLKTTFALVPFIKNLTETVEFERPAFVVDRNIIFMSYDPTIVQVNS